MGDVSSFFAESVSSFSSIDLRSPGCMFIESCAIQTVQWTSRPCKGSSTFRDTHLVKTVALASYLWGPPINTKPQILAHWLHHRSLYYSFLVVNFLNIPCLSCNVIGASSKHIRSFPHSRFSWYARNCLVRPTLLWVPYQSSKCVTHNQNYVF